ncbi:MAG: hypothetical protein ACTSPI_02510, partial [Candidatus Heimdallarchaeaceae archaeon]
ENIINSGDLYIFDQNGITHIMMYYTYLTLYLKDDLQKREAVEANKAFMTTFNNLLAYVKRKEIRKAQKKVNKQKSKDFF